jgi:hypothetical protein
LAGEHLVPLVRLTASQWIEQHRRGAAAMVAGRRHLVARRESTGQAALVEVDVEEPDVRCAVVDGRLDAEDLARLLSGFRGQPIPHTPAMRCMRASSDGDASAYVFDEHSGMVHILD